MDDDDLSELDGLTPDELLAEARQCLLNALAKFEGMRRALRSPWEQLEKKKRLNVRPRQRGPYPRRVE